MTTKFQVNANLTHTDPDKVTFSYSGGRPELIQTTVMSRQLWEYIGKPHRINLRSENVD